MTDWSLQRRFRGAHFDGERRQQQRAAIPCQTRRYGGCPPTAGSMQDAYIRGAVSGQDSCRRGNDGQRTLSS